MSAKTRYEIWIVYWVGLAIVNHLPPSSLPKVDSDWLDDVVHFLMFMLWALLAAWALKFHNVRQLAVLAILTMIYAAMDELTQSWVGRTPDLQDWYSDIAGMFSGIIIYWICIRLDPWQQRSTSP